MNEREERQRAETPHATAPSDNFVSSGVPLLDEILGGGVPVSSLTLIMGLPGSGKTTLASQIATNFARKGKTALILTALSESTNKLVSHLRSFTFFDPDLIGGPVQFLSLQSVLSNGLHAVSEAIITEVRRIKADIVVLDGFRGMRSVEVDLQAAREFLYSLGTTLNALGTTTIITSEIDPRDPTFYPEFTTADVIIGLSYQLKGVRQFRGIEIIKSRAAEPIPGLHALTLGNDGVHIYPQLEERTAFESLGGDAQTQGATPPISRNAAAAPRRRVNFGIPEFDAMLRGGVAERTSTLLAGSLGTGKTLLSIYFSLSGVRAGEPVVFLGFRETSDQLLQAAEAFDIGPELELAMQPSGGLTFLETPPIKLNADILADRLLNEIDRVGAKRVIIDSVAEIEQSILRGLDPGRLDGYLAALLNALRSRGVTALFIKETDKALTASLELSSDALSVLAENVILLQQLPYDGALHRLLSVVKMRFSDHDASLREFRITSPEGMLVLSPSDRATEPSTRDRRNKSSTSTNDPLPLYRQDSEGWSS